MLCLTLLLLSPAHPGPGPAQEPRAAADLAYCEVVPDRPVVWLGQELRVAFRFGVEESLRSERLVVEKMETHEHRTRGTSTASVAWSPCRA